MEKVFQRERVEAEGAPGSGNGSSLPPVADFGGQEVEDLAVSY